MERGKKNPVFLPFMIILVILAQREFFLNNSFCHTHPRMGH